MKRILVSILIGCILTATSICYWPSSDEWADSNRVRGSAVPNACIADYEGSSFRRVGILSAFRLSFSAVMMLAWC